MTLPKELQERFNYIDSHIFFDWEGSNYSVHCDAYGKSEYIVLPNDTVLKVMEWVESMPPSLRFTVAERVPSDAVATWAEEDYTDHLG